MNKDNLVKWPVVTKSNKSHKRGKKEDPEKVSKSDKNVTKSDENVIKMAKSDRK